MAIENTASQIAYVCDGVSGAFPTGWPILEGESVRVIEEVTATGETQDLPLNGRYTVTMQAEDPVTGQPGQGLVVAIGAAPAAGRVWHLLRVTRPVQPVVLPTAGQVPSRRLERAVDRQAMVAQESRRDTRKAVRVPDHEAVDMALPIARARAQRMLAFDAEGRPVAPGFTTEDVAAMIDSATLQLLAGAVHEFVSDGESTVWPLPAEWGLIYAAVTLLVNIGGVGGQASGYVATSGADHGYPGRTVIIFPQAPPVHVRVEVRVPPAASRPAVDDDTQILARASVRPRALADRFADIVNVLDEGAKGDGVADDWAVIQAAIDKLEAAGDGRTLYFPAGSYRLSASLQISRANRVNLSGQGPTVSEMLMSTPNTPILRYTDCSEDAFQFFVRDLGFRYAAPALPAHTDAVAFRFETGAGIASWGYYNFTFDNLRFFGCYRSFTNQHGATPPNLWGFHLTRMAHHDFAAGMGWLTNVGTGGGSPNCTVTQQYLYGRAGLTYTAPLFFCDSADGWTIASWELNATQHDTSSGVYYFGGARAVSVTNISFEGLSFVGGVVPALVMAEGLYMSITGVKAASISIGAGIVLGVVRAGTACLAAVTNVQTLNITGDGIMVGALEGAPGNILSYSLASPDAGRWIRNGGYYAPRLETSPAGIAVNGRATVSDAGTLSAPAVAVGPAGNGLAQSLDIITGEGDGVSLIIGANGGATKKALTVVPNGTANIRVRPSAPDTSASVGRALQLVGGPGGSLSGNGGPATLTGGSPTNGNGGSVTINGGAGAGADKNGGVVSVNGGTSTGTAAGAALTLTSGSNSTGGDAGAVTLRTGTGTGTASVVINARTAGNIVFGTDDTFRWILQGSASGIAGALTPIADNTYALGGSGFRPTVLYAVSGTINTSDEREKALEGELPFGLDFVCAVAPIAYRWREGKKQVTGRTLTGTRQVGETVVGQRPTGRMVERVEVTRDENNLPLVHLEQVPEMEDVTAPVMEDVYEPVYESVAGQRVHFGWSAQEVRARLGSGDYAVWTLDDPADPDSRQGLRPDQMTAILWQAVRDLAAQVETLTNRISVLED